MKLHTPNPFNLQDLVLGGGESSSHVAIFPKQPFLFFHRRKLTISKMSVRKSYRIRVSL